MERRVIVVCVIVGFLGFVSAILGFAAEATRVKASDVVTKILGECTYPKSPAVYLGLASASAVVIAQGFINTIAGCICCRRNANPSTSKNWTVALISFIFSWTTFIIGFLLLLTGAALNDLRGEQKMYFGDYCYVVKPGVFSGGAVLSLVSVSLGIVYFVALQSPKSSQPWGPTQNQGIALGQPQIPQQSAQPVFVHEDTYNRQQVP
ncbi:hypothetical protein AXF42_Ash006441 [Apostasia shenzhenica]|uniref:Uncharacterized protein n=1 Tax=Apostasia shenzhenica TaxID=1088818 RepID=A0A2I0AZ30_9ASPA|nr:hypothetical protein AXF42_Ash006441 [Apostasia shenzhenica]